MRLLLILVLTQLTGCAAYTLASTATWVATDKTLTDHAVTGLVPNGDCSIGRAAQGQYYCEIRDVSVTYNRSSF